MQGDIKQFWSKWIIDNFISNFSLFKDPHERRTPKQRLNFFAVTIKFYYQQQQKEDLKHQWKEINTNPKVLTVSKSVHVTWMWTKKIKAKSVEIEWIKQYSGKELSYTRLTFQNCFRSNTTIFKYKLYLWFHKLDVLRLKSWMRKGRPFTTTKVFPDTQSYFRSWHTWL